MIESLCNFFGGCRGQGMEVYRISQPLFIENKWHIGNFVND